MPPTRCTVTDGHMYYFDRYNTSIKDATRCQRACEASGEDKLTMNAPLPQQQGVLSVTKNKVQLIVIISEEINFKNVMMCP